jgi:uncharacterized membrane protein
VELACWYGVARELYGNMRVCLVVVVVVVVVEVVILLLVVTESFAPPQRPQDSLAAVT